MGEQGDGKWDRKNIEAISGGHSFSYQSGPVDVNKGKQSPQKVSH